MPHGSHAGIAIQAMRQTQKLTLRELAALAEVDYSMLSKVERGLVEPSARWLKSVTDALGRNLAQQAGDAA